MIDKIYIESAQNIRREFLRLSNNLEKYETNLKDYIIFLEKASAELEIFKNIELKKAKSSNIQETTDKLLKSVTEIENEEQKILKLIKPINDRIEKLREEENFLFSQIKEKYPNMTDEEIIYEVQSNLEK